MLNELGKEFLQVSTDHGFTTGAESTLYMTEKLMLSVSELAEALEELRTGNHPTLIYYTKEKPEKPEGFPIEIADTFIRLLQLCSALGIDIDTAVNLKNRYNKTRPVQHGKKF